MHDRDVVRGDRHHKLQRRADLRHIGPAAFDPGERLRGSRHDLRRRQPGNGDHRNHRPLAANARVAVRAGDVATANRNERNHPPERQSAGGGRIEERRGRLNCESERRPLRPDDEHVQPCGRERVSPPLSFRVAAPTGRHGGAGWRKSVQGSYENHIEVYSPAYLFKADGTPASRPTITGITPNPLGYGNSFQIQTPDAANIASVVLMRLGSPTHAFDMDQRLIRLSYTAGSGVLNVDGAATRQHRASGLLHALRSGLSRRAVAGKILQLATRFRPPRYQSLVQRDGQSRRVRVVCGVGHRCRRQYQRLHLVVSRWGARVELGGHPWDRRLCDAGHVCRVAHRHRQCRCGECRATRTVMVSDFAVSATPGSRTVPPGAARTPRRSHRSTASRARSVSRSAGCPGRDRLVQSQLRDRLRLHDPQRHGGRSDPADQAG